MMAFRTILCPIDTSDFSARAARHAMAVGRTFGAKVVAMSVRPVAMAPDFWRLPELWTLNGPVDSAEAAEAVRAFVQRVTGEVPADVRIAFGQVASEIIRVAGDVAADLIVMWTHGLGGFERLMLGSVTERVLRKTTCPVLTVSGHSGEPGDISKGPVVCGLDRSAASRRSLDYALAFARHGSRRLVVVHALEDISDEEPQFGSHINAPECWRAIAPEIQRSYAALVPEDVRQWCTSEVRLPIGRAHQAILATAGDARAGLIVLGTAGTATPLGSTTHRVMRDAGCPVLAVPPARAEA
jgi:nucleotide-binding universal stress UspA family protein